MFGAGYVRFDFAQVQTAEGKLYLYVVIDCVNKGRLCAGAEGGPNLGRHLPQGP
ncbi:hypothetical protein [Mesorhizobium sp. AaZ16]|uniref:hypothetical protein n=1 Tax=Mesorhizobium sp. AaZ16 TaxID=3402289 RepID=UPI003A8EF210